MTDRVFEHRDLRAGSQSHLSCAMMPSRDDIYFSHAECADVLPRHCRPIFYLYFDLPPAHYCAHSTGWRRKVSESAHCSFKPRPCCPKAI